MARSAIRQLESAPTSGPLTAECANPRCDEVIHRTGGRGRPRDYHDEECRRATGEVKRRLEARLEHYLEQVEILRERYSPYEKAPGVVGGTSSGDATALTAEQVRVAREAVAKIEGAAPFLRRHDGEFAPELVELFEAVAPVVRAHL